MQKSHMLTTHLVNTKLYPKYFISSFTPQESGGWARITKCITRCKWRSKIFIKFPPSLPRLLNQCIHIHKLMSVASMNVIETTNSEMQWHRQPIKLASHMNVLKLLITKCIGIGGQLKLARHILSLCYGVNKCEQQVNNVSLSHKCVCVTLSLKQTICHNCQDGKGSVCC